MPLKSEARTKLKMEPWQNYQQLLRQQNRQLSRLDFLIDSDSSESSEIAGLGNRGHGEEQSTSGSQNPDSPQPSTSGVRPSTSVVRPNQRGEETSDSEISDLSSSFGSEEPALRHFHEVTKNLDQDFLPVTSLQMPALKRKKDSKNPNEPIIKKRKTLHDEVMGIDVNVIRAHHRQEKTFGFLVS